MVWTRFKNEWRIPKKVLNMKVKGKRPRRRPRSGWEQQIRKDVTPREEVHGNKQELWEDRDAWQSETHLKWKGLARRIRKRGAGMNQQCSSLSSSKAVLALGQYEL
jgi:hypothetical protein